MVYILTSSVDLKKNVPIVLGVKFVEALRKNRKLS